MKTVALVLGIIIGSVGIVKAADYVVKTGRQVVVQRSYHAAAYPKAIRYLKVRRSGFLVEPRPEDRPLLFFGYQYYAPRVISARY